MKMKIFAIFALWIAFTSALEIERDRGVLILNKDNFHEAVQTYKHILVEFYAPWCGHCKALEPEYIKAAEKLQESNSEVLLAKVDATEQTELAKEFNIRGYPTLKLFRNGKPSDFRGGRNADDIVKLIERKTNPALAANKISNVAEAKQFEDKSKAVVLGVFRDLESSAAQQYLAVAQDNDGIEFGIANSDEVRDHYEVLPNTDAVIVLKKFDYGKSVLDVAGLSYETIAQFVATETVPLVIEMNRSNMQVFRGDIKNHILFFVSQKAEESVSIIENARKVAKEFRGKIVFLSVDTDDEDNLRLEQFFGVTKDGIPTMRILHVSSENLKYKPEYDDFSEDYIKSVVQNYLDGKMKPHYLAQELPEDWDKNPVKILVSSNFDSVTLDETKDVLVEFYAPWCGHCQKLEPIYEALAEKFKDNTSITIAKMDGTLNELEHVKLKGFPTIKLYKRGNNEVVDYTGQRTLEAMIQFLEDHIAEKVENPIVKEEL